MPNMSVSTAFVFIDSRFQISQHLQQVVIKQYCERQNLQVTFYGAEVNGSESRHLLLQSYIDSRSEDCFVFFSISQFISDGFFQRLLLEKLLLKSFIIHFASESIVVKQVSDLENLYILLLSKPFYID